MHKHYFGSVHSFEILKKDDPKHGTLVRPNVTILKTFFINDKINKNSWQTPWEGLKEDAHELIGIPLVLKDDLEHPTFAEQSKYEVGMIFDYDIDEEKKQIIVYIRVTDDEVAEKIRSGELEYVSPAVIPRSDEFLKKINGVDVLSRTLGLHLSIVGNPAYGEEDAKMSHICHGDGKECYHRLKTMKASFQAKYAESEMDQCVARKIKIIMDENPDMKQDQAIAIAYSMCEKNKEANVINLRKASTDKIKLLLLKANLLETQLRLFNAAKKDKGRWITTEKGQRVFIPEGANVKETVEKAIEKRKESDKNKSKSDKRKEEDNARRDRMQERINKLSPERKRELAKMTFDTEFNRLIHEIEAEKNKEGKSLTLGGWMDMRLEMMKKLFKSLGKIDTTDERVVRKHLRKYYDELDHEKFFRDIKEHRKKMDSLKNEKQNTRELLDRAIERNDEKTVEDILTKRIDNLEKMTDSEIKYTLEKIRNLPEKNKKAGITELK